MKNIFKETEKTSHDKRYRGMFFLRCIHLNRGVLLEKED